MHRFPTASFWKAGALVFGAIARVICYQFATTISAANIVINNAERKLERVVPPEVYRTWDSCNRGLDDYADRRVLSKHQCLSDALSVAQEVDQAKTTDWAFSEYNRALNEGAAQVERDMPWPLSVVIDPLYRLVMRSLG